MAALALLAATHVAAHAGSVAFWRITLTGTSARSEILLSPDDVRRVAPGDGPMATTGAVDESRLHGLGPHSSHISWSYRTALLSPLTS